MVLRRGSPGDAASGAGTWRSPTRAARRSPGCSPSARRAHSRLERRAVMTYGEGTRAPLRIFAACLVVGLVVGIAGRPLPAIAASPAAMDDPLLEDGEEEQAGFPDPLEPMNRYTFR